MYSRTWQAAVHSDCNITAIDIFLNYADYFIIWPWGEQPSFEKSWILQSLIGHLKVIWKQSILIGQLKVMW